MLSYPVVWLRRALLILFPLSLLLTTYIYLYPAFDGCAFPLPEDGRNGSAAGTGPARHSFAETVKLHMALSNNDGQFTKAAPFRLLALGDPQLEGDSSIPNAHGPSFPHFLKAFEHWVRRGNEMGLRERYRQICHEMVDFWFEDIPNTLIAARKRLDLFGNDFYLAHIFRTMRWWTKPTHVCVLGDLLGSQWVDNDEFDQRAHRFWHRVFRSTERVPDEVAVDPTPETIAYHDLGDAASVWPNRIINVVGNHDIGYAGDITEERMSRFERAFGKANYELRFRVPSHMLSAKATASLYDQESNPESDRLLPELRIVNLNDMNLDTPALSGDIQDQTYQFINAVINTAADVGKKGHFTLVLTHVPLYKPESICVDAPYFSFYEEDGTLKEQNQLSQDASKGFLQGILGMHPDVNAPAHGRGRRGAILNGHDHEGCDTYHFVNQTTDEKWEDRAWETVRWTAAQADSLVGKDGHPGVREITVRSMMGDFGGNAGLFSAWFDEDTWDWKFEFATCAIGRQHLWWVVHILDLICLVGLLLYGAASLIMSSKGQTGTSPSSKTASKVMAAKAPKVSNPKQL